MVLLGSPATTLERTCLSRSLSYRCNQMLVRAIKDLLSRIETQTIEMKLLNPVRCILDEEFAH